MSSSLSQSQLRKKRKAKKKSNKSKKKKNGKYREKLESKHSEESALSDSEEIMLTRVWVCSWNMAAKDHFKFKTTSDGHKIADDDQTQKFEQIVPTNYDLYVFGVQEGVSDTFFKYISLYLSEFDVRRIALNKLTNNSIKNNSLNKNASCFGVHGRGDGSFINTKFTGIAVYYRKSLSPYISLKSTSAVSCGLTQGSKGAAAILLKIYSTSIVFLSTHMSSNSTANKLEHFKTIVNKTGDTLGCHGFDLLTQFHHIIWFGDLNYRIQSLTADNVLQNMALGNLHKLWLHDSLKLTQAQNKQCAFKNFKEPIPRLDFYPTYKKKPNRQLDFDQNPKELQNMSASSQQSSLSQLDKIYTTKYKEPFYKGGTVQDRIPSFCDRVLYHSLHELNHQLNCELDTGVLNCVEFSYKKDKCNNYGCIPHHLMGSDHSAIYCGMTLQSQMLFPCPPHELNDRGLPKSYQLKIEDIKIMRKSPYHMDSTYSEFPIKTKILFPAPYEIENFKYKNYKPFAYTILQQDLEMYHHILRQIDMESKRRLSKQNRNKRKMKNKNNKKNIYPLMTPQISQRIKPSEKETPIPISLMDMDHNNNQDTLIAAKPMIDKGLNSKKIKRKRDNNSIINNSDDDMNDMPSYDILTNPDTQEDTPNPLKIIRSNSINSLTQASSKQRKPKSPNRMINDTNSNSDSEYFADIQPNNNNNQTKPNNHIAANRNPNDRSGSRRDSAPNIKNRQMPSDYIFKSEDQMEIEKQQIQMHKKNKYRKYPNKQLPNKHNKYNQSNAANPSTSPRTNKKNLPNHPPPQPPPKTKKKKSSSNNTPTTPAQLSPKNSTTSPATNGVPSSAKPEKRDSVTHRVHKKTKQHKKQKQYKGGIASDNPLRVFLDDDNEDAFVQLDDFNLNNTKKKPPLNKSIVSEDYFDSNASNNEEVNDIVSPIKMKHNNNNNYGDIELPSKVINSSPSSQLQRTRSKSMGSFAETFVDKSNDSMIIDAVTIVNKQHNSQLQHIEQKHNMVRSDVMDGIDYDSIDYDRISSPIYKDLADMSKKLTIISFGPSRRPTNGNIHCVLKVESNDFKGQCCIPLKWSDFSKEVENIQYAELSYHGIPLYDKTGSPVKCKIHYKLSLIDKQIVFEHR